jgi:hypothetical protein
MTRTGEHLCYIDAAHVLSPVGEFADFDVRDAADHALGKLNGFIVDPVARQLRYFVVEVRRWLTKHRYLVPLCPATLECDRQTVRFEFDQHGRNEWREFDDRLYSGFSDEDLLDALFASARPETEVAETREEM